MPSNLRKRPGRSPRGFSLVEAMIGVTVLAMAGAVLLLGMETSLRTTIDAEDQTIAAGMAQQLVDEVLGQKYMESAATGPLQYPFAANAYESAGSGRERYNDTDDYHGFRAQPPKDAYGIELGRGNGAGATRNVNFQLPSGKFARWRQEIDVYYVSASDPSVKLTGSQTSYYRCLEVRISRQEATNVYRTLATVKRVYAYVPPPP
jgi:type II secretory pathway pseudopilin PulG